MDLLYNYIPISPLLRASLKPQIMGRVVSDIFDVLEAELGREVLSRSMLCNRFRFSTQFTGMCTMEAGFISRDVCSPIPVGFRL